jgi:glutamine cyclotransferase
MFQTLGDNLMHDRHHFTQGLTYSQSSHVLYESNGLFGESTVCKLNPNTGETLTCIPMDKRFFAEGMQVYGKPGDERLIQITWKSRVGFIYNADTLEMIRNFTFSTVRNEGWGICYDDMNHEFIVSDGSNYLHFWDADSLIEKRRVAVTRLDGRKALKMNELEFVNGKVLANVWYEDVILVIDPQSGNCQSEYGE